MAGAHSPDRRALRAGNPDRALLISSMRWLAPALVVLLVLTGRSTAQETASTPAAPLTTAMPTVVSAMASVESAEYTAELQELDLVNGHMKLDVVRSGTGPGVLDWSDVKIAINRLQWQHQAVLAGTTAEQRMIVLTDHDSDQLSGSWSANGKLLNQQRVFDLTFPTALNTRITLRIPVELGMEASHGVLQMQGEAHEGLREWRLELGNLSSTTLRIGPIQQFQSSLPPRYEIETEFRARRDGIFMKADVSLEGPLSGQNPLQLIIPENVEIQSLTLFSGSIQSGTPVAYFRSPQHPDRVTISTENLNLESRFTLRIRGFQPANWGEPHQLARIAVAASLETRRNLIVRVESPLQLQAADVVGMLQTNLSSEESSGEVWRYEAREPDSKISVTIDLPQPEIVADISCLADARKSSAWVAVVISMHVENGSRFNAVVQLPEDWKLISVAAGDAESRMSSWTQEQRTLRVNWQNPMTAMSHRQLRLFARTSPWKLQASQRLQLPQVQLAGNSTVTYQMLLPTGYELQIADGEGWRVNETTPITPSLLRLREVTERLTDPLAANPTTLKSAGESRSGRPQITILPRALNADAAISPELTDSGNRKEGASAGTHVPGGDSSGTDVTPVLDFHLLTMLGPSTQQGAGHQAELQFDRPVSAASLNLKLPISCILSAVEVDGRSVTVFRKEDEIPLPAELTQLTSLRLTYMTGPGEGWLYHNCRVPVPTSSIPVASFHWTLDLPRDQRLSRIDLPGVLSGERPDETLSRQFFGPLTRRRGEAMFNPLSRTAWQSLLQEKNASRTTRTIRRSSSLLAPTVGGSVEFVVWDVAQTRSYAWVALLGCLMIGAGARLFRISWLRQIALIWLTCLLAAVMMAPPAWGLIFGGMLAGSLLSILIPRRWMQSRDFLLRHPEDSIRSAKLVGATSLLLGAVVLPQFHGELFIKRADAQVAPATSTTLPLYLIESARYVVTRVAPSPQVRATFQVLTRPQSNEIFVRLPLQDVVFASAADCLVNGQKQTLIPSVSGDAMVVALPGGMTPQGDESEKNMPPGWVRSEIQLDFFIRQNTQTTSTAGSVTSTDPRLVGFQAVVPNVLDSILQLPANLASTNIRRWGERTSDGEAGVLLHLGGIGTLRFEPDLEIPQDLSGLTAVTILDVSPLRFKGQTRILPGPIAWPRLLPVTLPPGCVISSISGSNVIDYIAAPPSPDATSVMVRLRAGASTVPIQINFELPATLLSPGELVVPAFPLWGGPNVSHILGLSTSPTSTIQLAGTSGLVSMPMDEWPADSELGRNRPVLAVKLVNPQPVPLTWTKITPVRVGSIAERLLIQREGVEWTATVRMNVTRLPAFRQQFRIDPSLRIESVTASEGGTDGGIRYSRTANVLTVFIPGGLLGERTIVLTGRMPLAVDAWSGVPTFEVLATTITDSVLTLLDSTGWNVELEGPQGAAIPTKVSAPAVARSETPQVLGEFRREMGLRPEKFRVTMPIEAARADSVLYLHTGNPDQWEAISTFHLTAIDSSLKKAVFHIPADFTGIRIRSSLYQYTSTSDTTGTTVNVKIPEKYSTAATITISARLNPRLKEELLARGESERSRQAFPMIEILSAQKASQFVLVDPKDQFVPAPTGSLKVDAAAFPAWAPGEWVRGVKDKTLVCYQQIRKDLNFVWKSASELSGHPVIRLDETVIWPLEDGSVRGLTRIWLAAKGGARLQLLHGDELTVDSVLVPEQGMPQLTRTTQGSEIDLPEQGAASGMVINWTSRLPGQRLQLLNFGDDPPTRRLVAVQLSGSWKLDSGNTDSVGPLQIWLERWNSLLQCVHDISGPVSVDSILLGNIRLCQQQAALLKGTGAAAGQPQLVTEYIRLESEWNSIKDDLVISGNSSGMGAENFESVFTELLSERDSGLHGAWLIPRTQEWSGTVIRSTGSNAPWKLLWISSAILLAFFIVFRFSKLLSQLRDTVARHPSWSMIFLGMIWWTWFSPSIVGLLLILGTWGWEASRWAGSAWSLVQSWKSRPAG